MAKGLANTRCLVSLFLNYGTMLSAGMMTCVLIKLLNGWLKARAWESGCERVGTVSHPDDPFVKNTDNNLDAPKFFHIDSSNHLIVQRVVLVSAVIQPQSDDSGSTALAALNPFKAPASEHIAHPDNRGETCRLTLEDQLDIGELKPSQKLKGSRVFFTKDRIRGITWSDSELYVGDV
jgi:hypothetical protein